MFSFLLRSSFLVISIYLIIVTDNLSRVQALVPASSTFKLVNQGDFGDYIVEYDGNYRALDVFTSPFQLCFYNTTPNAYTLALRMGLVRSESLFRWVWEANRGNPVRENATLTFGTDGNLVLANSDGRIAWQTNTTNKGVVGFELLPNGNMVLHDAKGNFIWQSFDYPTDTLLVGQSFRSGGPTKLVSRVSAEVNFNGPYSLVMEPKRVAMYYKSPFSPTPLLYYTMLDMPKSTLKQVTLDCSPDTEEAFAYDITFTIQNGDGSSGGTSEIARPKYNSTLSLLRLGIDGNLKVYTYSDKVDWAAWEATFTLFSRDSIYGLRETECQLPERCGNFGLCEDDQCVACPTPKGLLGWSKNCQQPKGSCGSNYYKLDGVDHFLTKFTKGDGPMTIDACGKKCNKDCKCLGYFYHQQNSRCWIAFDLKTLTKVSNGKHVGYIKS
ncbi:epidermis-specific secreted glycoprotein EP1-like [Silene latifolia]|uniref:epidermis-specific secreted glycoprotein EP1-like n=1 Tax=Silene latifolia TaxID=37657 RepID=UPI003D78B120